MMLFTFFIYNFKSSKSLRHVCKNPYIRSRFHQNFMPFGYEILNYWQFVYFFISKTISEEYGVLKYRFFKVAQKTLPKKSKSSKNRIRLRICTFENREKFQNIQKKSLKNQEFQNGNLVAIQGFVHRSTLGSEIN